MSKKLAVFNKNVYRGDSWVRKFTFLDSNDDPVDITGLKITITLKSSLDLTDDDAELQITTTCGDFELDDAENGIIYWTASPEFTDEIVPGNYYYDLQTVSLTNDVLTRESGTVRVLADVTRSI
jgi:hypothetical protein